MNGFKITLCDEKTADVHIKIWAQMVGGCLTVTGQDIGIVVENCFGSDEYEYWYRFDRANTERLLMLLADEGLTVENSLSLRFGGADGCKALRDFCDVSGIKYEFSNYF